MRVLLFTLPLTMLVLASGCLCHDGCDLNGLRLCHRLCDGDSTVMALAAEIDCLEHHIDRYGSIVAKTPAIWGESRLMRHRLDYEQEMFKELSKFEIKLNGYISRSDQAYLTQAMSLQAALPGFVADKTMPSNVAMATAGDIKPSIVPTAPFALPNGAPMILQDKAKVDLEPTLGLDQKSRYLQHLQHLRRINEGDDTGDSPGYSLTLVRIPISVLPGKLTRKGYGAEITMSINPQFGDDLLPRTYRNLVLNDLVDLLGVPIFDMAEEMSRPGAISPAFPPPPAEKVDQPKTTKLPADAPFYMRQAQAVSLPRASAAMTKRVAEKFARKISTSLQRRSNFPLAPTHILPVFGEEEMLRVAEAVRKIDSGSGFDSKYLLDVHKFLGAELEAAYELLQQPTFQNDWWNTDAPRKLGGEIRATNWESIEALHKHFKQVLSTTASAKSVTAALAWAVAVEASLLNDRLLEDIKHMGTARNCAACQHVDGLTFYGPNPSPQACKVFEEYVRHRWPIHVFALDPVTQDENLGDVFSRRRETQLAMALAFANGQVSANTFTRAARRLETDMSTIALHRTAAGFAHGANHFGWRFFPRFQTPPTESHAKTFLRDMVWGGPSLDCDTAHLEIETGQRECVAIVIMPSILPYITIDTRSNWFKLTNPGKTEISMKQTMRLSESIKRMETCACTLRDADRYRDGEAGRLLRRVEQLSAELPLQTLTQQVPVENTLGGFAMFNSGLTDLAPQLTGYYGDPLFQSGKEATIYLVGNHFSSVHGTQVLAGNRLCESTTLSRRILMVKVPVGVPTGADGSVDVQVATPYGVSNHIQIGVAREIPHSALPQPAPAVGRGFFLFGGPGNQEVRYTFAKEWTPPYVLQLPILPGKGELAVECPEGTVVPDEAKIMLMVSDRSGNTIASDTESRLMTYETQTNRLVLAGPSLQLANERLKEKLEDYLRTKHPDAAPPMLELELVGRLTFRPHNVSVPVSSQITLGLIQLMKKA